jgi:hypothetical protein
MGPVAARSERSPSAPRRGSGKAREQLAEAVREDRGSARSEEGACRDLRDRVAAILKERLDLLCRAALGARSNSRRLWLLRAALSYPISSGHKC